MKKITLMMIASGSMLFAAPAMDTNVNMQGKGMKMMQNCKYQSTKMGQGMHGNKMMMKKKMAKNKMNSPFLIKHGLPHLSKMIMPYLDDPSFNLTADQKEKLTKVRINTMGIIMETKTKVIALRKCIEETKAILTKDQLLFLLVNKNKKMKHGKKSMMNK